MSILDFLNNKQDFFKLAECIDFLDLCKITVEERDILNKYRLEFNVKNINSTVSRYNKILELCKLPIFIESNRSKSYLENAILFGVRSNSYSSKDLFLLDKESSSIIVDTSSLTSYLKDIDFDIFANKKSDSLLKDSLAKYKIFNLNSLKKEVFSFIQSKNDELVKKNYSMLCELGRKDLDEDCIKNNAISKVNKLYVFDKSLDDLNANYVLDSNIDIFYNTTDNYYHILILYLRDKNALEDLINSVFYRFINSNSHKAIDLNQTVYKDKILRETLNELEPINKTDVSLNTTKEIIKSLKLAGKTVVVNGQKCINYTDTYAFPNLSVGRYSDNKIEFDKIETISFGRKILFDKSKFLADFKANN